MPDHGQALLCAIIAALAKTWDTKLPGYKDEFKAQLIHVHFLTEEAEVKSGIEDILKILDQMP
jgi:hypothetical protein